MKDVWLVAAAILLLTSNALAANIWHASTIKRIYPLSDGSFVLTFTIDAPTCPNTNTHKYHYVAAGQNGVTVDGQDKMYALAIAAATSGSAVSFNFDDSGASCYINRMYVLY